MNIGDKLDPISLGHNAIDLKTLLQSSGYVMPQGSVAKLPRIPSEVQKQIDDIQASQEQYITLSDSEVFGCEFCGTNNSGQWRKEILTGIEFIVCGECHTVVGVR